MDTINPYVKNMEYAVRGRMPQEAAKIEAAIRKVSLGSFVVSLVVVMLAGCCHVVVVAILMFEERTLFIACKPCQQVLSFST